MHPLGVGEVIGSATPSHKSQIISHKNVKVCTYATLIVRVEGRTSRQRSCNQRVGCLKRFGSRAFIHAKRSGNM